MIKMQENPDIVQAAKEVADIMESNLFVSTHGHVSADTIKRYIEEQKTRQ